MKLIGKWDYCEIEKFLINYLIKKDLEIKIIRIDSIKIIKDEFQIYYTYDIFNSGKHTIPFIGNHTGGMSEWLTFVRNKTINDIIDE